MDKELELARFIAVVDEGSVSRAARVLGMPRPTLSRQISRMEERLGVRLMHRSTRRLVLTEAGEELARRARPILTAIEEAEAVVKTSQSEPKGKLRVSVMPGLSDVLARMVDSFQRRFPDVRIEAVAAMRHVDLVEEGFDLALRAGSVLDERLIAKRISSNRAVAVATGGYIEAFGAPNSIADLAMRQCVLGCDQSGEPRTSWPKTVGGSVRVRGVFAANELAVQYATVLVGRSIGLFPETLVADDLKSGRLVQILPGVIGRMSHVSLVYPERRLLLPQVRLFVDHAHQWMRDAPVRPLSGRMAYPLES